MTSIAVTQRLTSGEPAGDGAERPGDAGLAELVRRAGRRDESAWRELLDRYSARVFALALLRLRSREAAEDVTQSVFAAVSEQLARGGYREDGRFEAWLFRIANNRVRDEAKRASRRPRLADFGESVAEGRGRVSAEDLGALRRAIAGLGEKEQELLSLRHQAQLAFADIAELTGEPVGTLLARHHRALAKLRAELEAEMGPE